MSVDVSKLHGPPLPMKFKVVVKETGEVLEPEYICMNVVYDLVKVDADSYMFESVVVIQSIGRKDRDKVEVFMGDVLEFDQAGFLSSDRACVRWDILGQNLRLLTRSGTTHPLSNCENGRIIGNIFADKTLMEPKQEGSHV